MKISLTPEQAKDLPYPLGCKFCRLLSLPLRYHIKICNCNVGAHIISMYFLVEMYYDHCSSVGIAHLV